MVGILIEFCSQTVHIPIPERLFHTSKTWTRLLAIHLEEGSPVATEDSTVVQETNTGIDGCFVLVLFNSPQTRIWKQTEEYWSATTPCPYWLYFFNLCQSQRRFSSMPFPATKSCSASSVCLPEIGQLIHIFTLANNTPQARPSSRPHSATSGTQV
ncbi:hypothetical protein L218DRAFT_118366 [Marasmius fiardii PR-910]|nr:hypothetical protein L218DRAFT_118366 [Marasmius fiardii PR-910]